MNPRVLTILTGAALLVLAIPGCLVTVSPPAIGIAYGPALEYGDRPLRYDGYVVYFSDHGRPYYWRRGVHRWIPDHARARYSSHWHRDQPVDRNWYRDRGSDDRAHRFKERDGRPPQPAGRPSIKRENRPVPARDPGISPDARRRVPPRDGWRDGRHLPRASTRHGDSQDDRAGRQAPTRRSGPIPKNEDGQGDKRHRREQWANDRDEGTRRPGPPSFERRAR